MLKSFFSPHNPLYYPALLVLVALLWVPAFDLAHAPADAARLWVAAEQFTTGKVIYRDVWLRDQPLLPVLYGLFRQLFGSAGWAALQVLGIGAVLAAAALLNRLVQHFRLMNEWAALPGFWLVLLLSLPMWRVGLRPETLVVPLALALLWQVLEQIESPRRRTTDALLIGALCFVAFMIEARSVFLTLPLVIAGAAATRPTSAEFASGIAGALMLGFVAAIALWATDALLPYVKQCLSSGVAHWAQPPSSALTTDGPLFAAVFAPLLVLSLLGLLSFRARVGGSSARMRQAEVLFGAWYVGALLLLLLELPQLRLESTWLLAPPIAFYSSAWLASASSAVLAQRLMGATASAVIALSLAAPLWRLLPTAALSVWPLQQWLGPASNPPSAELSAWAQQLPPGAGLWVIHDQPQLYLHFQRPAAVPYLDAALTQRHVLDPLRIDPKVGIPAPEVEDLYRLLLHTPPEAILGPPEALERLDRAFPLLMAQYGRRQLGPWLGFRRLAPPLQAVEHK